MTAESVLESAGFDYSSLNDDNVTAQDGPLSGSRSSRTTTTTGTRRRRASKNRLDSLQVKLSQQMFMAGTMIGLGLPTTGYYACQESDAFTKAVIQLAAKRPEWVEALEHLADIQPGIIVGRTCIGLGAALAVDRGRADPDKRVMAFLGVTNAYYASREGGEYDSEPGSAYAPPPSPAFTPVE